MRILWICGGLLPQACEALGIPDVRLNGGFMGRALQCLADADGANRLCVLCWDARRVDVEVNGVRHVSFGGRTAITTKGVSQSDCERARRVMDEFDPDIIHILGTEGLFAHMPDWVFAGHKTVISLQGIITACAAHYSGLLTPDDLRRTWLNYSFLRYGTTCRGEQRFWMQVRARLEAETMRRHQNFIGRTDFDLAWVRYYNPNAKYYRVDENMRPEFYCSERNLARVRPHSVFCGGAVGYPLKGGHIVIKAVAALRQKYPDVQLRIANASGLSNSISLGQRLRFGYYTLYLRRLIRELGMAQNIVALGPLSAQEVRDELEKAEVFALPSFCENSPNALAEAMLVGTPAVATDVGGVSSLLRDGMMGRLVPVGDPACMAQAIARVFDEPTAAREMASVAQRASVVRHDVKVNTRLLLDAYQSIIDGN